MCRFACHVIRFMSSHYITNLWCHCIGHATVMSLACVTVTACYFFGDPLVLNSENKYWEGGSYPFWDMFCYISFETKMLHHGPKLSGLATLHKAGSPLGGKMSPWKNFQQSNWLTDLSPRKNIEPRIVGILSTFRGSTFSRLVEIQLKP